MAGTTGEVLLATFSLLVLAIYIAACIGRGRGLDIGPRRETCFECFDGLKAPKCFFGEQHVDFLGTIPVIN